MSMESQIEIADLRQKLTGSKEEAIWALNFLNREKHRSQAESLKQEIISLAGGESISVCVAAGALLLYIDPGYVAGQSWLALRLASVACSGAPLGERMPLMAAMARMDEENRYFYIERCLDRDGIVDAFMARGQWAPLLSLLRVSLLWWKYDVGALEDLFWLIRVLLRVKEGSGGKEAAVFLKQQQDDLQVYSKVLGRILIDETLAAAAGAWVRCLKGPGGDNICLENTWVFKDEELTREILESLGTEPVAFALFIDEIKQEDGIQKTHLPGVADELLIASLTRGIRAAEYSLSNLLSETLRMILKKPHLAKEFSEGLGSSKERMVAVAKLLSAENQLAVVKALMQ